MKEMAVLDETTYDCVIATLSHLMDALDALAQTQLCLIDLLVKQAPEKLREDGLEDALKKARKISKPLLRPKPSCDDSGYFGTIVDGEQSRGAAEKQGNMIITPSVLLQLLASSHDKGQGQVNVMKVQLMPSSPAKNGETKVEGGMWNLTEMSEHG